VPLLWHGALNARSSPPTWGTKPLAAIFACAALSRVRGRVWRVQAVSVRFDRTFMGGDERGQSPE